MDGNSPIPTETGNPTVLALKALQGWLALEGGNSRQANVLRVLVDVSLKASLAGQPLPFEDREKIRLLVREHEVDTSEAASSKWLPPKVLMTWWWAREASRRAYFQSQGLSQCLELRTQEGGGRGNTTRLRFEVSALPDPEAYQSPESTQPQDRIEYQSEPARAVWWLRWLLPPGQTVIHSWRGPLIALFALASMAVIPLLGLVALNKLNHPGPITAKDLQTLLLVSVLGLMVYRFIRPWWQLPLQRLTIASDFMLATNQLYGQLQLVRDRQKKVTGTLSLVRYYAACSHCGGTVELAEGGRNFPSRIIGRCRDSPSEHVYSFDPVTRRGLPLR